MSISKQNEFLALYEPLHERFERFCRARVYGDMEYKDLMNETLLIAYDKFESLRSKEAFLSYLFSISVRILSNNYQKKKELHLADNRSEEKVFSSAVDSESMTDVHFLYEALAMLNEEQRESIILFEISGFSIKEISVIQNTSESSVKQRLRRGRLKLNSILNFEADLNEKEVSHG